MKNLFEFLSILGNILLFVIGSLCFIFGVPMLVAHFFGGIGLIIWGVFMLAFMIYALMDGLASMIV